MLASRVDCYALTKEDYFGRVVNGRFLVHKLRRHIMALYAGFELGRKRLRVMREQGVREAFIFFHPNVDETIFYRASIDKWLSGQQYSNGGCVQCMLPIRECERD